MQDARPDRETKMLREWSIYSESFQDGNTRLHVHHSAIGHDGDTTRQNRVLGFARKIGPWPRVRA